MKGSGLFSPIFALDNLFPSDHEEIKKGKEEENGCSFLWMVREGWYPQESRICSSTAVLSPRLEQPQLQRGAPAESFPLCKALEERQKGKKLPFPGHEPSVWSSSQQLTALVPLSFGVSTFTRVEWQRMCFCSCLQDSRGNTPKNLIFRPNLICSLIRMVGGPS